MKTRKSIREYKRNGNQFSYILDSISGEDFNVTLNSDRDRISFFFDTFNQEFNYIQNRQRTPNLQQRISEYLKGLPSCIDLPFYDDDIKDLLQNWDIKPTAKNVQNFWVVIACRLIQIANYYNIDLIY